MDNIATQLQQLATIKANLANVISTYGGEVPEGFYNYAETFSTLLENTGGSGGGSEEPEPQTQTRTLTNKLYDRFQNEYQNAENSSDPMTNLNNDSYLLRVVDNNGVYLTDNDITPGDMIGYANFLYDGEEHGWWISLFAPGFTAADFEETGIDLSGSVPIEYEYYDPNTGDPINQENQAVIYYDFTGLH